MLGCSLRQGVHRANTLLNVLLDNAALGGGGGGQEQLFLRVMFSAFVHLQLVFTMFFALSHSFFLHHLRFPLGFYSVFRLHDVGDATPRWGGGDVNVPCNLLTLLMLRHAGVGGMLTFHVTCSRC